MKNTIFLTTPAAQKMIGMMFKWRGENPLGGRGPRKACFWTQLKGSWVSNNYTSLQQSGITAGSGNRRAGLKLPQAPLNKAVPQMCSSPSFGSAGSELHKHCVQYSHNFSKKLDHLHQTFSSKYITALHYKCKKDREFQHRKQQPVGLQCTTQDNVPSTHTLRFCYPSFFQAPWGT